MNAMSDYLESKILNHIFRNVAYTPPTKIYAALFTSDPLDAGTGTEVTGAGYKRAEITMGAPEDSGDAQVVKNSIEVAFPVAQASWGTVTHVAIMDASAAGNVLYHGVLANPKDVSIGDIMKFLVGDLILGIQ